jgi:hypothetical protein
MSQSTFDYESSDEEVECRVFDRYIRFGKYKDQTVSQVCRTKEGRLYLRWANDNLSKLDEPTRRAINEQLKAYDLYKKSKS